MMNENEMLRKLKTMISESRYQHTLRVRDIAVELALVYNIDVSKVNTAAILHDCAKGYSFEECIKLCKQYNIEVNQYASEHKELIHAPLGAQIAQVEFEVEDGDILNAIRYHTTGRANMSLMEKVIWIADYIEPKRTFDNVEEIRELARTNIDKAILMGLNQTIDYVVSRGWILHPATVMARDSLILK